MSIMSTLLHKDYNCYICGEAPDKVVIFKNYNVMVCGSCFSIVSNENNMEFYGDYINRFLLFMWFQNLRML